MLRLLHIFPDQPKFVPVMADLFSRIDGVKSAFLLPVSHLSKSPALLKQAENLQKVTWTQLLTGRARSYLAEVDALLVHFMTPEAVRLLSLAPQRMTVVWSGWGGDYTPLLPGGLESVLDADTRRAWSELVKRRARSATRLGRIGKLPYKLVSSLMSRGWPGELLERIDFFSSPIPEDYFLLKDALGSAFRAKYLQLNYGSVERTFSIGSKGLTGGNVLVGNSATPSNNHLDVFRALSAIDLGDRRLIVPLSYGLDYYKDLVIREGRRCFGSRFEAIEDFLPLDQYNDLISSCSVAVMGHKRQQALGNTCTLLYRGAKVFLDGQCTTYRFFKSRGADVFPIDRLNEETSTVFDPLGEDQVCRNRKVLQQFWGQDVVDGNARTLVRTLEGTLAYGNHGLS